MHKLSMNLDPSPIIRVKKTRKLIQLLRKLYYSNFIEKSNLSFPLMPKQLVDNVVISHAVVSNNSCQIMIIATHINNLFSLQSSSYTGFFLQCFMTIHICMIMLMFVRYLWNLKACWRSWQCSRKWRWNRGVWNQR